MHDNPLGQYFSHNIHAPKEEFLYLPLENENGALKDMSISANMMHCQLRGSGLRSESLASRKCGSTFKKMLKS